MAKDDFAKAAQAAADATDALHEMTEQFMGTAEAQEQAGAMLEDVLAAPDEKPEAPPQDAPGEPEQPPEASEAPTVLEWLPNIPQDVPDDAEAWAREHEWQLEHNPSYQNQFAPKPKK